MKIRGDVTHSCYINLYYFPFSKQFHAKPIGIPQGLVDRALNWLQQSEVEHFLNTISKNTDATESKVSGVSRALSDVFYGGVNRDNLVAYLHVVLVLSVEGHLSSKVRCDVS